MAIPVQFYYSPQTTFARTAAAVIAKTTADINTPHGLLDAYIRIVQGDEFGTIALVVSPSNNNLNGAASLQKNVESLKQKDSTLETSLGMPHY